MSEKYDVLVIGGGAAGLTTAGIAVNLGAKTLMVEQNRLGGDCTWTGCIPSKTLIRSASIVHSLKQAGNHGLSVSMGKTETQNLMKHIDTIRREVYDEADRPEIYEKMGIEVVSGSASFVDEQTVKIQTGNDSERNVTARYIFICTGSKPVIPQVPGIENIEYLTNESIFEIENLPHKLVILGAGPVGVEMAQSFARLGTEVKVVDMQPRIISNDDQELAEIVRNSLETDGIEFLLETNVKKVNKSGEAVEVITEKDGEEKILTSDKLFLATGRAANIDSLNLEAAGVDFTKQGISVSDTCRTSRRHIYAVGDVTGRYQFTHMSEHMAKVATSNALLKIPVKIDVKHVPRVTFTDPELAQIGGSEKELSEKGVKFEVYRFPFSRIDRAITDGNTNGMIKVFAKKWSGKILGATIAGAHAGEMISQYALAMKNGISLRKFADTIHPYPTYGLGARRAADQWYIKNQSASVVKWVKRIFRYRGEIPDYSDPDRIV